MKHWAHKYVGIPFAQGGRGEAGVDCWGLLRLVYEREYKILLPEYPGVSLESLLRRHARILSAAGQDWKRVESPQEGCAVAMSQIAFVHHVGIWVPADGGRVLHSWEGGSVVADSLRSLHARGFRVLEYYLHRLWPASS